MPKGRVIIRRAKPNDFWQLYLVDKETFPNDYFSASLWRMAIELFSTTLLVAEVNGVIVGYLFGARSQVNLNEAWFLGVAVKADYRGKGIGARLLERGLKTLKRMGIRRVWLTVSPTNEPAIKLYLKYGFRSVKVMGEVIKVRGRKTIKDFYGPKEHRVVMQKSLA